MQKELKRDSDTCIDNVFVAPVGRGGIVEDDTPERDGQVVHRSERAMSEDPVLSSSLSMI
jgi:hypothetical protein